MKLLAAIFLIVTPFWFEPTQTLPTVNAKVIAFVDVHIGKQVDRGECWDLANKALTFAGAKWQFPTTFGKPINYLKEPMLPGDLVQFENAKFEFKTDTSLQRWSKIVHTGIVYKVINQTHIILAEQNNNNDKHVRLNPIDFKWLIAGKIFVYRPVDK